MGLDLRTKIRGYTHFRVHLLGFVAIFLVFGPGLHHFLTVSFSADRANDDSLQVTWPLLRYGDPPLFIEDPIADYYIENQMPLGYHALMAGLARVFDAVPLSTAAGHLSFIVAAVFAFLTGRFLAGAVGAWICVALILASDALLSQTAGGLPRAMGFALAFMVLYGFLCDRRPYTAFASILGALFWYPIAALAGALYAVQCLAPQEFFGWKEGRSLTRRAAMVLIVGCLAMGLSAPRVISESRWGSVVSNSSPAWPEAGPGGRLDPENQLGLGQPLKTVVRALESGTNRAAPWLNHSRHLAKWKFLLARGITLALLVGLVLTAWNDRTARRLLAVLAISICLYIAAIILAPVLYAPSRFVISLFPGISVFAFVYLGSKLGGWLSKRWPLVGSAQVQLLAAALAILVLGGRPYNQGYEVIIGADQRRAIDFISGLPREALIAGWPESIVDDIPLFSRRRVLISNETHLPFHEAYLRDARAKTKAIMDVWFSPEVQSLRTLSRRYGVTHFVIDKERRADPALSYFKPFDEYILKKRAELDGRKPWIDSPPRESIAFENESVVIIDLERLAPRSMSAANRKPGQARY